MKYSKKLSSIYKPVDIRPRKLSHFVHGSEQKSIGFQEMPENEPE